MGLKHGIYGLYGRALPRLMPGKPIPAATGNAVSKAAEAVMAATGPGGGIGLSQTPTSISARLERNTYSEYFITSGTITAASLSGGILTFGKGNAVLQIAYYDGTNVKTLTTGKTVQIYNGINKIIASGAAVRTSLVNGQRVVDIVYRCEDLS